MLLMGLTVLQIDIKIHVMICMFCRVAGARLAAHTCAPARAAVRAQGKSDRQKPQTFSDNFVGFFPARFQDIVNIVFVIKVKIMIDIMTSLKTMIMLLMKVIVIHLRIRISGMVI
jgi:hypothetical protein